MNLIVIVYTFSLIIALLLLFLTVKKSEEIKAVFFGYLILHIFIYILGVLVEITSETFTQAAIGNDIQYLGICFLGPYYVLTICECTNRKIKNKLTMFSLFLIPIISFVLVLTYPLNGLFYEKFEYIDHFGLHYLYTEGSIFHLVLYLYLLVTFIVAILIIAKTNREGDKNTTKKVSFLIKGMVIPVIAVVMYILKLIPYDLDNAPLALLFLCVYYGYNILYKEVFLTTRFARSYVVNNLNDGYLLVDLNNNYIDSNKMTKEIFPVLENLEAGNLLSGTDDFPKELFENTNKILELPIINCNGKANYYNFKKSFIRNNKRNEYNCWLIYDVTQEVEMKQKLEILASQDPLTKILNRKRFYEIAKDLFLENEKNKNTFSLALIDIDFFKKINDTYGHNIGDKVLIRMTEVIKKNIRETDVFARYGGEEFILFFENTDFESGFKIAEKLRQAVEKDILFIEDYEIKITISIGVATYNKEQEKSIDELIEKADKFLYEAKKTGRNKVIIG